MRVVVVSPHHDARSCANIGTGADPSGGMDTGRQVQSAWPIFRLPPLTYLQETKWSRRPDRESVGDMSEALCSSHLLSVAEMLDIYTAPNLLAAVRSALEEPGELRIDLGGSHAMHAAALQILVATARAAKAGGQAVKFQGVSPEVAALWRLTGLDVELASAGASEEVAAA